MAVIQQQQQQQQQGKKHDGPLLESCFPDSVEEAAALLGATITKCGATSSSASPSVQGMHPAFAVTWSSPSNELVSRLYVLRALLRTTWIQQQQQEQSQSKQRGPLLPTAPSILQVLKKLLPLSTQLGASLAVAGATISHPSERATVGAAAAASAAAHPGSTSSIALHNYKPEPPPLWSTPCRTLWVDCVVLCHALQSSSAETTQWVRQMLLLASVHPRSAKAAGGVRIAALQVVGGLLEFGDAADDSALNHYNMVHNDNDSSNNIQTNFTLASMLAPWSLDVLQVCLKALRSAGHGEPTYRLAAVRAACATATACRNAALKSRSLPSSSSSSSTGQAHASSLLLFPGTMEDKAVAEAIKVLRQAATDKFPEVRSVAATLAARMAPLLVPNPPRRGTVATTGGSVVDPLLALEEVVQFAGKNLDDESPATAKTWADALARCICTAIYYHQQQKAQQQQQGDREGGGPGDNIEEADVRPSPRFAAVRRQQPGTPSSQVHHFSGLVHSSFTTLPKAIEYLVDQFVQCGGELGAARLGGTFSTGGRAVRLGYSLVLTHLLRLQQSVLGNIGEGRSISWPQTIHAVLDMLGPEMERKHLNSAASHLANSSGSSGGVEATAAATALFGSGVARTWSKADGGLARLATSRVLRHGLAELAAEPVQLALLHELLMLLTLPLSATALSEASAAEPTTALNSYQLQAILTEISHLLATLGEAAASKVDDVVARLQQCLAHEDNGVRHEAAVAMLALANSFPSHGRKLVLETLEELEQDVTKLWTSPSDLTVEGESNSKAESPTATPLRIFRRGAVSQKKQPEPTSVRTPSMHYAIHGKSLMVSLLLRDLTKLPGGLPRDYLRLVLSVADTLVASQFHEKATPAHAPSLCFCVRAGFCLISGVLATGPDAVEPHMSLIVDAWQNAAQAAREGGASLSLLHDLVCMDAILASMVCFLKFCSELLLIVPQALNRITIMLESIFPLLQPSGRFGAVPSSAAVTARLESSRASLLEAFAWLPSGSFPMVADDVFPFACSIIQKAVEDQVTCSILFSLVTKEDCILDAKTLCRANRDGQVGGARDLEESIITLTSEMAANSECESVIHLRSDNAVRVLGATPPIFRESCILEHFASDFHSDDKAPTPLHEVGTWRKPHDPSCSAGVRIVDAAIQAFSATFGLKDGKEQQNAMQMLESLIPPSLSQLARTIGLNSTSTDHERRGKVKEDSSAVVNITAVLLSCLQALPLHEATHNIPIGLGPPWMNTAKDLLLTLLPSNSTIVRRAAAEGLALLATLGVTEDAHFLQSTLLHSLDEVMQGNKPDGKARPMALEPVSAARSGSLLTLACIQRTAHNVSKRKGERARGRVLGSKAGDTVDKSNENLPVLQMMTRIIPSAACYGFRDFFVVKAYALHSFAVLLIYSARLDAATLADEDKQLLRKAVELVEDNFTASWTASSADVDRGQEAEKMTTEVAFLAVLLRFMTFLVPYVTYLKSEDRDIVRRFAIMAAVILESQRSHPVISLEAMAFFEVLAAHQDMLPVFSRKIFYTENPVLSCLPSMLTLLSTMRPAVFARGLWQPHSALWSGKSHRALVFVIKVLSSHIALEQWTEFKVVSLLISSLEGVCGAKHFSGGNLLRAAAASREIERYFAEGGILTSEIFQTVKYLLAVESTFFGNNGDTLLRWLLLSRYILSSSPATPQSGDDETVLYNRNDVVTAALSRAARDGSPVFDAANPIRWQVKSLAAQMGAASLAALQRSEQFFFGGVKESPHFDFVQANKLCLEECRRAAETNGRLPASRAIFHLEDLLSSASVAAVATINQAELRTVQESAANFLIRLIECFGPIPDPEDPMTSILDQFSTQIFSCVKHALNATTESEFSSPLLFVAGCEVLHKIVENKMNSDPMVLKRLIRPAVLTADLLPPFRFTDGYPKELLRVDDASSYINTRGSLAARVASIWTSGRFLLPRESDEYAQAFESLGKDLIDFDLGLAIHSAACAFDGCRLLHSAGLSLVGRKSESQHEVSNCGFHYQNESDIDESVKEILVRTWSSCASRAVKPLLAVLASESAKQDIQGMCMEWIDKLLILLMAGIYDGINAMRTENVSSISVDWARGIDTLITAKDCLDGMSMIATGVSSDAWPKEIGSSVKNLVDFLVDATWLPAMEIDEDPGSTANQTSRKVDESVMVSVCNFLRSLAESKSDVFHQKSTLLVPLLRPLNILQKGKIMPGLNSSMREIVATCLTSIGALIRQRFAPEALVKAMYQIALNDILTAHGDAPNACRVAGKMLLIECLGHDSLTTMEQESIANDLVTAGNWDGWMAVAAIDDGNLVTKSLDIVQETVGNSTNPTAQVAALTAVRELVQKSPVPNALIGRILFKMGADIIGVLYRYGTMKIPEAARPHRTGACAEAMKITLTAYQQISAEEQDEVVASFLLVVFETLLAVLRFNGVPNHPSPEVHNDPALGRMCAQAILHVARTTPGPFKSCVALLADHERPLLEFAVRAEMSGYAVAGGQPQTLKKINLAGFKK